MLSKKMTSPIERLQQFLQISTWIINPLLNCDDYNEIPLPFKFASNYQGKLYLGRVYPTDRIVQMLVTNNIQVIISLGFDRYPFPTYASKSVEWYGCNINDNLDEQNAYMFESYLPNFSRIIDHSLRQGKNVYVHCVAGVSRSATTVIYFILSKVLETLPAPNRLNNPLIDVINHVKTHRKCINPNPRFLQICYNFQQQYLGY
jgi:predicted protein tyrosine phosphatase